MADFFDFPRAVKFPIEESVQPEIGRDLCLVKGSGGKYRGYRIDILTEKLPDILSTLLVCKRCRGILRNACLSIKGEQICECCRVKNQSYYYSSELEQYEETTPNAHVRNTVLSLKCSCPLYQRGCEWIGTLGECENHLYVCGHVHEKCKLGCKIVLPRHEHKIHVSEKCVQRMIPCEHCKGNFKVCDMSNHLEKCPKMPLTCELECGMLVCREDVARHLEEECVEKKVECPFIKYKCEVGLVKRKELNQHLEDKRTEHTELKLRAMEEIVMQQGEMIAKQSEIIERQFKTLFSITNTTKLEWRIENVATFRAGYYTKSQQFQVDGFYFTLELSRNGLISICFPRQGIYKVKAKFIFRMISHSDPSVTLESKSNIIEIKQKGCSSVNLARIPLKRDEFITAGGIDLEIFVILQ